MIGFADRKVGEVRHFGVLVDSKADIRKCWKPSTPGVSASGEGRSGIGIENLEGGHRSD